MSDLKCSLVAWFIVLITTACGNTSTADPTPSVGNWRDLNEAPEPDMDTTDTSSNDDIVAPDQNDIPPQPDVISPDDAEDSADDLASDVMDPPPAPRSPEARILYLLLPDRFANGSTANDTAGASDCFNPSNPRLFHGGDLVGLQQRLDYLDALGVNTLWTTPLYRQVGRVGDACGYHGYWANFQNPDDGALEPYLGDAADFNALLEAMHARGLDLVLDMVVNHAGYNATLTRQHPSWFHGSNCATLGDPEIYCPLAGLPDFAQDNAEVAAYLNDKSRGWVERFAIDGIRLDTVKHIPFAYLRDAWLPAVRGANPDLFVVGEFFDDDLNRIAPYLDAGFDSMFNFRLRGGLIDTFAKAAPVGIVAERIRETVRELGIERALRMTNLLDNHDVPRFTEELTGATDTIRAQRYQLALVALFTLPGIPQLYYGNELGMRGNNDPDNRRDMPSWAWQTSTRDRATTPGFVGNPAEHFDLTRDLIALRTQSAALTRGDYVELWRPAGPTVTPQVLVFARLDPDGGPPVIVAFNNSNTDSGPLTLVIRDDPSVALAVKGALTEGLMLTNRLNQVETTDIQVEDGNITLRLPALRAGVWMAP